MTDPQRDATQRPKKKRSSISWWLWSPKGRLRIALAVILTGLGASYAYPYVVGAVDAAQQSVERAVHPGKGSGGDITHNWQRGR